MKINTNIFGSLNFYSFYYNIQTLKNKILWTKAK